MFIEILRVRSCGVFLKKTDVTNGPRSPVQRKGAAWVQGAPEHTCSPWERWGATWWQSQSCRTSNADKGREVPSDPKWHELTAWPGQTLFCWCLPVGKGWPTLHLHHFTFRGGRGRCKDKYCKTIQKIQEALVWTVWKTWEKKWKGKSSEKTTCYEPCTMTIDKQDKEKKLQRSQVPADPGGKRRQEQKWRTGLPFEKTTLNPDLSYPVENHTLLFLWQIFSLSDAAQGDYLCRHTNVTFIFRHWYSPLLYIHILHFLHF